MNRTDADNMEAWLYEVEQAHSQITAMAEGKMDTTEFDRKQEIVKKQKEKEIQQQKEKEMQQMEDIKQGSYGKGGKGDYASFCKYCFREYKNATDPCLRCNNPTQTNAQRMAYLNEKVAEYKENKLRREERKSKWALWKKTKAMLWSKTATMNDKWDYFTDSEEEQVDENADPVLPNNDPAFQAMEHDMNERCKRRTEARVQAEQFKLKGNKCMEDKDYAFAVQEYTSALDLVKDYKALYTNRALAYIKMNKFLQAIDDCQKVIDYCECFEDGYQQSKESCFKAFLRKAYAQKELKRYNGSSESITEAIKLCTNDKEANRLKVEIDAVMEHERNVKEMNIVNASGGGEESNKSTTAATNKINQVSNENDQNQINTNNQVNATLEIQSQNSLKQKQTIDDFIKLKAPYQEKDIMVFSKLLKNGTLNKVYFYESGGIAKISEMLQQNAKSVYYLMNVFLLDNLHYQNQFIQQNWDVYTLSRAGKIIDKLVLKWHQEDLIKARQGNILQDSISLQQTVEDIDEVRDIFELLTTISKSDKVRYFLNNHPTTPILIEKCIQALLGNDNRYKQQPCLVPLIGSFFSMLGNLCCADSFLVYSYLANVQQEPLIQQIYAFLTQFLEFSFVQKNTVTQYEDCKENAYNLISNLLTKTYFRDSFYLQTDLINKLALQVTKFSALISNQNVTFNVYGSNLMSLLGVFINLTFQANPDTTLNALNNNKLCQKLQKLIYNLQISEKNHQPLLSRITQILSKLDFTCMEDFSYQFFSKILSFFDEASISSGVTHHVLRLLYKIFNSQTGTQWMANNFNFSSEQSPDQENLLEKMIEGIQKQIIAIVPSNEQSSNETKMADYEQRFCNSCNVANKIIELFPSCSLRFRNCIPKLLEVCKEKLGNQRKNAAIMLAKLAKEQSNLEAIRSLHGIEILYNVSSFILKPN